MAGVGFGMVVSGSIQLAVEVGVFSGGDGRRREKRLEYSFDDAVSAIPPSL